MTSTQFTVGLSDDTRISSRVLRPPGGGHTNIFEAAEPVQPRGRRHAPTTVTEPEPAKPTSGTEVSKENSLRQEQPITPDPEQQVTPVVEVKTENSVQSNIDSQKSNSGPQKRTHVPPGGYSSGFW